MLKKLNKSNNKGFTIIEVMIVLAIVGLIMLIVFLAVPALQRNSRNTNRKSDVGRLGSAATTLVSNLNGAAVSNANFSGATLTTEAGNLGYYTAANVTAALAATGNIANNTTIDTVRVLYNASCNGTNAQITARQVAILYSTENGNGAASPACVNE